ncbi:hypothetical protein OU995_21395 [Roseateles sp. SL47]|uniref:hypothetical protein n=1 Tax=Roseateles sp. SL47 TaxID=2995138 RepID=UPI00226ECE22|nr:hypothetical protein [Roseateles sp. SL47]WAC72099.1 hypothetical protein OU995_21395 [Roseateles sp. SL47]
MSDFFAPMTTHIAKTARTCIWCGERLTVGQPYCRQSGVWDGQFFTSRYHPECWDALGEQDDPEFTPHENERPLSSAEAEYRSWDCAALFQASLL